jgi:hypothetical protein
VAFTYVDPSQSNRDKVRFLIGDTDSTDYHMTDEEIAYLLTTWTDVYSAAIAGAEIIASQFAHKTNYSRSIGDLSISESYQASAQEFFKLADRLRNQKNDLYPPSIKINSQAIMATADKSTTTYTTDFHTGIHDYNV